MSSPERLNNCLLDTESTPHRKILTDFWEGCEELLRISLKKKPWTLDKSIYSIITYLPSLSWCSEKIQKTKLHYHWYWQRWLWWQWSLGEDDLFSTEILIPMLLTIVLCSCLRNSGLFLSTAVRLLARLLMSLLSYLLMEWRNTVSLLFLFTSCTQDCTNWRTGTEEYKRRHPHHRAGR